MDVGDHMKPTNGGTKIWGNPDQKHRQWTSSNEVQRHNWSRPPEVKYVPPARPKNPDQNLWGLAGLAIEQPAIGRKPRECKDKRSEVEIPLISKKQGERNSRAKTHLRASVDRDDCILSEIKCGWWYWQKVVVGATFTERDELEGIETVDASNFITLENIERLKQAKEANRVQVSLISAYIIKTLYFGSRDAKIFIAALTAESTLSSSYGKHMIIGSLFYHHFVIFIYSD
ncbi:hypothetical protein NE237_024923 [Protea cynaroides]|uniref:Uncharacterized protein n=1 Tax=Protea cynaroides TaxID=273540 RepID=A0A9Q0K023_9MAGN|nr:hypothetical protein NE237_024923 [Protea cynaroides]